MNLRKLGYAALVAATAAVIAIGSAVPSEAKTKKKPEAAPAPTLCLIVEHHPVCGVKGGTKVTYANGCYAAQDGAKVVSQKACPAGKMAKPHKEKKAKMAPAKKEKTKKAPAKKGAKENNKKT